jgi:hypothetical protein
MSNEEEENNKLIGEFDGWKFMKMIDADLPFWQKFKDGKVVHEGVFRNPDYMKWGTIMPVVQKIGDMDNQADIEFAAELKIFKDEHEGEGNNIFETSIFCHIGAVHSRVAEFAKWYNKNKTK